MEEHLADRGEVQLLRGQRAGEDVGAPTVLLFALRLRLAVLVEDGLELRLAEVLDVSDVVLPGRRPADVIDEAPCLPEGEVDAGDPGTRARESSLELREGRQSTRGQRAKHVALQPAVPTGDQLSAARSAREIDAMDIHDGRAGWALVVHVRVPGSPLYGPAGGVTEYWRVIARAASSRPGSSVSRVTFSRRSSRMTESLLALGTSRTA